MMPYRTNVQALVWSTQAIEKEIEKMSRRVFTVFGICISAALAALIITISTVGGSADVTDTEKPAAVYQSIQVQGDDTLWSIAETYAPSYHLEIRDYIREIKKINNLQSDRINEGMHLIVVSYE